MPRLDPARTTLSPARRAADLERMRARRFDLLVVGGGVLGFFSMAFLLGGVVAAAFAVGKVLAAPRAGADRPS